MRENEPVILRNSPFQTLSQCFSLFHSLNVGACEPIKNPSF